MKKLLLLIPILLILAVLSGCVRENDMAESIIFVHTWNTDHNEIRTYTKDGEFITAWTVAAIPDRSNQLCADVNNNVYMIDVGWDKIYKYDKSGTLLVTKAVQYAGGITAGPDGYIYELGYDDGNPRIIKRDPDTLDIVATMVGVDVANCVPGFACDGDGYLYTSNINTGKIEKWDFDSATMVASRTFSIAGTAMCVAPNLLGGCTLTLNHAWTMPLALDADQTAWDLSEITYLMDTAGIYGNFLFLGYHLGQKVRNLVKYTNARSLVWNLSIGNWDDFNLTGVAAYPFAREEAQPIIALIG